VVSAAGITGAGVALDAASRVYSVPLVSARTSLRAPLALVEARARRLATSRTLRLGSCARRCSSAFFSLLVKLAPHLVGRWVLLVVAFDGKSSRPLMVVGQLYDLIATAGSRACVPRRRRGL